MNKESLDVVECCATCKYHMGWFDNMWCWKLDGNEDVDPGVMCYNRCEEYVVRAKLSTGGISFYVIDDD